MVLCLKTVLPLCQLLFLRHNYHGYAETNQEVGGGKGACLSVLFYDPGSSKGYSFQWAPAAALAPVSLFIFQIINSEIG